MRILSGLGHRDDAGRERVRGRRRVRSQEPGLLVTSPIGLPDRDGSHAIQSRQSARAKLIVAAAA